MFSRITKYFTREKKKDYEEEVEDSDPEEREFTTLSETYKLICFALGVCLMYPSPKTQWFRLIATTLVLASVAPLAMFILIDIYRCWMRKDIIEIIRHSTIVGPFLGGFLKMYFMVWKQKPAFAIITEINRDYAMYNQVGEEYKAIVRASIRNNLVYSEKCWMINVIGTVMTFPAMAIVLTLYSQLFDEEPKRYMIHELNKPWDKDPEARFESPFFELMAVYMFYCCWVYVFNFLGYDGFYGLAINHACLKITMYCKALEDAMKYPTEQVCQRVVWVIMEQNRTFEYINQIQDTFNMWLGIIFLATMIQLCNLLYHISEGFGFDLRYMVFITGVTIHIFLPCHYSAKLKAMSEEVGTQIYCSGWETVWEERARRMLVFMIARAQVPLEITALNMLVFDMNLFISILQTSYSMYTLLSS